MVVFQSTRPRRARHVVHHDPQVLGDVSIHAPAEGATAEVYCRVRCHPVSIHAPAEGATHSGRYFQVAAVVSIHAPAEGATSPPGTVLWYGIGFNPRARGGRDLAAAGRTLSLCQFQSTRPRRARLAQQLSATHVRLFQSTRPRRARPWDLRDLQAVALFQSTRPRRARPACAGAGTWPPQFQSTRPRRARLPAVDRVAGHDDVSIHAPAEGATC